MFQNRKCFGSYRIVPESLVSYNINGRFSCSENLANRFSRNIHEFEYLVNIFMKILHEIVASLQTFLVFFLRFICEEISYIGHIGRRCIETAYQGIDCIVSLRVVFCYCRKKFDIVSFVYDIFILEDSPAFLPIKVAGNGKF